VVKLVSRLGHTPSDVTIEVSEPHVMFCGDLVWNGMFPNYRDAIPSKKAASVRALLSAGDVPYVPGHGNLARKADLERYLTLLDDVGEKARDAIAKGIPLDQAAEAYQLPAGFQDWVMFSPTYFKVAFQAWGKELGAK
jgi:glyoxylase-like metal-dependent hydrolase (beta-lactamase superfamily II)